MLTVTLRVHTAVLVSHLFVCKESNCYAGIVQLSFCTTASINHVRSDYMQANVMLYQQRSQRQAKGKHTRLCSNNTGSCFVQLSRWIFQGFAIWHKNSLHRDASDTSVKYINQNDGSSECIRSSAAL